MSTLNLLATGDVAPRRADPESMFAGVRESLHGGDIVFGQLESTFSDRGSPAPQAKLAMRSEPAALDAIRGAGFDVMSFAGNHCLDWGEEAFFDTLEHAARSDLQICGAGRDIAAARRPIIVEHAGTRIAFLAYSSILPEGYWAETDRPGCAPMRASTIYLPLHPHRVGSAPRVETSADCADLEALKSDVRAAKRSADIVAVSLHWGIHFVPSEIAAYQTEVAHGAVDEGADMILGHHPHILKGIEIYKGRPIFYSLGNFAIEQPQAFDSSILQSASFKQLRALNPDIDPNRMFIGPPDGRKSMIARLTIENGHLARIAFVPVEINEGSDPEVLLPDDQRFHNVVDYVRRLTAEQGLGARFTVQGAEVVVTGTIEP